MGGGMQMWDRNRTLSSARAWSLVSVAASLVRRETGLDDPEQTGVNQSCKARREDARRTNHKTAHKSASIVEILEKSRTAYGGWGVLFMTIGNMDVSKGIKVGTCPVQGTARRHRGGQAALCGQRGMRRPRENSVRGLSQSEGQKNSVNIRGEMVAHKAEDSG